MTTVMVTFAWELVVNLQIKIIFGVILGLVLMSGTAILSFSQTDEFSDSTEIIPSSSTITDNIITDNPLSESIPVIKTMAIFTSDELSVDKDITLDEIVDGFVVSIIAKNTNISPKSLDAENWYYKVITPLGETLHPISESNFVVPPNGSLEILKIDLSEYENLFETFPGIYTVELVGSTLQDKNFGEYNKFGNFADYHIKINLKIDYDVDAIKQQEPYNGLLKADGIQLGIREASNEELAKPYELNDNSPKKISFYLKNENNERISSLVGSSTFFVWDTKNRYPAVGTQMIAEVSEDSCQFLDPGEAILINSFDFSKGEWPINSIAMTKIEQNFTNNDSIENQINPDSLPGTYILKYDVGTIPCSIDGQTISGGNYSLIASMEVL